MRTIGGCALALALAFMAGQASALAYTLTTPSPFEFDTDAVNNPGGAEGTINSVDPLFANNGLDANDTVCLLGACDLPSQDWLIFSVSVTNSAVFEVGVGLPDFPLPLAQGLGYFLLGNPMPSNYVGNLDNPDTPIFRFTSGGLVGNSLVLFVAYASGTLPNDPTFPFTDPYGTVNFMIAEEGTSAEFSAPSIFTTPVEVVPEPGTALLVGLGLLGLAAARRRV